MDFSYPPEAEAFRREFRSWLEAHLDAEVLEAGEQRVADDRAFEVLRTWNTTMADAGYGAIAWPREFGGRGAGVMDQVVFAEEMSRLDAPGTVNVLGVANIAPAIIAYGTEEQKRRFLHPMLRADDVWCQGMSEPDAGSDLASLRCRAERNGDRFVVNGQKTWNTLGHRANWCQLFVRTDPEAPKHKGISCLLVDMTLPGVEVRPLTTITGDRDFNEVFFDDVHVPVDDLLGPLNDGWRVATTTLSHERAGVARLHLGVRKKVRRLFDLAKVTPFGEGSAIDDPVLRQRLARVYVEAEHLKLLADRAISAELKGRSAGPESSIAKLAWTEVENHLADVAGEMLGADGLAGPWGTARVSVRALSIAGGTTQINKNVVAQRILGLPRA